MSVSDYASVPAMDDARSRRTEVVLATIAAFAICYGKAVAALVETWSTNYLYSYGFAIPFIAAYIAWTRSQMAPVRDDAPDYLLGVPATLGGIVMMWIGSLGAIGTLEQVSLVVTMTGLVLILFGRATLKLQWFAIACLLLMIPIWNRPIDLLQDPSRLLSTRIAVAILRTIGMPVLQQGTNIMLPGHTLAVLRECSGVNQLIAITAMVLPAAYLWLRTNARRVAIVAVAIVVSYLGNGVRIALTGWLTVKGLSDGNPGTLHLSEGLAISALGYLVIGACFSLFASSERPADVRSETGEREGGGAQELPRRHTAVDVAVLVGLLAAGGVSLSAGSRDVPLRNTLSSLDARIGDWTLDIGQEQASLPLPAVDDDFVGAYPSPAGESRFAAVDEELVRAYRTSSGARVQLYVGYYRRQDRARDLSSDLSHGLERSASAVVMKSMGNALEVKEVVREKNGMTRGVLFWYDINGRVVGDIYSVKTLTLQDALTRRRSNGAIVMVAWKAPTGTSAETARRNAIVFVQAVMPVLRQRLPS